MRCFPIALFVSVVIELFQFEPRSFAIYEKSLGIGATLYTGKSSSALAPPFGSSFLFSANNIFSKRFNVVNRFELGGYFGGKDLGGSGLSYNGYFGTYSVLLRTDFSKETIFPYFELGPTVGIYEATISGADEKTAKNQMAFKAGYDLGVGFDYVKNGKRGSGSGWGIGVSYFSYFPSPSIIEFASGRVSVSGFKLEIRYLLPSLEL